MHYFIGLDNGGTATKAALFDRNGKEVGKAVVATASITPKPGFVERDMEEMWEANCRVISQVLRETGIEAKDVAGIGIAGHGKGLYLWGKDGKPARNGIISTDNRARTGPKRRFSPARRSIFWPASRFRCWPGCGTTSRSVTGTSAGCLNARTMSASASRERQRRKSRIIPGPTS